MEKMQHSLDRKEDPRTLTPITWIRRAINLPIREIVGRIVKLTVSLLRNILAVGRIHAYAEAQGKVAHFIVLSERMGDIIAAGAAIENMKQPKDYIVWLVRGAFMDVLKFNPYVDAVLPVSSYTETVILRRFCKHGRWSNLQIDGALCNMFGLRVNNLASVAAGVDVDNYYHRGTLADVYSLIGTGHPANRAPKLYFDPNFDVDSFLASVFAKPNRPLLVFHPASDEFSRSWTVENSAQLAVWLRDHTDFNILEVGLKPYLLPGINTHLLRGDLSLSRQLAIISRAALFIGVDSGFSHAANAAGVSSIHLIGRYKEFKNHLPWFVKAQDIVIRCKDQTYKIPLEDVTKVVSSVCRQGHLANLSQIGDRSI